MNRTSAIILLLSLACVATTSQAGRLYKWVDSGGKVSYHDRLPPEDSGYSVERKDFKTQVNRRDSGSKAMREAVKNSPVILYSVPKCAPCDLARSYLNKNQIPFKEKDVEKNRENSEKLDKLSGARNVPTITVGDKVITGFTQDWLEGELKSAGYPFKQEQNTESDQ